MMYDDEKPMIEIYKTVDGKDIRWSHFRDYEAAREYIKTLYDSGTRYYITVWCDILDEELFLTNEGWTKGRKAFNEDWFTM